MSERVERVMELADEYADAAQAKEFENHFGCDSTFEDAGRKRAAARAALEAEVRALVEANELLREVLAVISEGIEDSPDPPAGPA